MKPEAANLTNLLSVTDHFLEHCREQMTEQQALIDFLAKAGERTEETEKLLAVFADVEKRFLDYRRSLEGELVKIRNH